MTNAKPIKRIGEIDFLKSVCIVLMVMFHLVYIADKYPAAKDIVYVFHMPIFLLISGYLSNITRGAKIFFSTIWWIFCSYAILELGYVIASSILPVRDTIEHLSFTILLDKVFINPMGPYWYLHTFLICSITYFFCFNILKKSTLTTRIICLALVLYCLSGIWLLMGVDNALYFLLGVILRHGSNGFTQVFRGSWLAIIPIIWLCCSADNLNRASLSGVALVISVITFLIYIYKYIPSRAERYISFIGMNTMPILLFSPIFTMIAKFGVDLFAFEQSGVLFALVATSFAIGGSFALAYLLDKVGISRFMYGRNFIVKIY